MEHSTKRVEVLHAFVWASIRNQRAVTESLNMQVQMNAGTYDHRDIQRDHGGGKPFGGLKITHGNPPSAEGTHESRSAACRKLSA